MPNTKQHREAMAVANTILFLRRNGQEKMADWLSHQAIEEGMPSVLIGLAWEEAP